MKLRIAASMAVGVVLIGILAWPLAKPDEPFGAVSAVAGAVSLSDATALLVLAVVAGFIGYFVSWPYGREIGILAVPTGLGIWAFLTGSMAELLRENPVLEQRVALYAGMRWESPFWLAVVAAGFAGVLLAQGLQPKQASNQPAAKPKSKQNKYLIPPLAIVAATLMALACIKMLARDVAVTTRPSGTTLMAQPATAQIAYAVIVSFGVAAFVVKKLFDVGYICPAVATIFVTLVAEHIYAGPDMLGLLHKSSPPLFFASPLVSILPVQMVAFGALGSVAGYWVAVRYSYWREHE
jgi:hypothetical protein